MLGVAALGLVGVAGFGAVRRPSGLPPTTPIPSAPGFVRLPSAGRVSGAGFALIGLDDVEAQGVFLAGSEVRSLLFSDGGEGVPIAVFSDYFCPVCPQVGPLVQRISQEHTVRWHEWPVLGRRSDFAARIGQAAAGFVPARQVHDALMALRPRPSGGGVRAAADALGIPYDALSARMAQPVVKVELETSAALAYQLGLQGTPAFVIGRVVLSGLPTRSLLRQIVRHEAERVAA